MKNDVDRRRRRVPGAFAGYDDADSIVHTTQEMAIADRGYPRDWRS